MAKMISEKARTRATAAGLSLFLLGAVLTLCSMPAFTFTRNEIQQVQKSETIMDYSFNIHQSQDKIAQVQLSTGQELNILAKGSGNFNFSIANFTNPSQLIQPDQPDQVYLFLTDTTSIETTWTPAVRSAQPGSYYLVFLARNSSADDPVRVNANVTKTWMSLQTVTVPYQSPLLDSRFKYVGSGIAIFGVALFLIAFYTRHRSENRRHSRVLRAKQGQRSK